MKSKVIESEWITNSSARPPLCIGFVLVWNDHDGFKVYAGNGFGADKAKDIKAIRDWGSKIPFDWAWGIFGKRMRAESFHEDMTRSMDDSIRYDSTDYLQPAEAKENN